MDELDELAAAANNRSASPSRRAGGFTCRNCGYHGKAKKRRAGSILIMICLLLIMVLPGLLYAIFYGGMIYVCPKCGLKVGDAV